VILGFRREADGTCAVLGCYAGSSGNFSQTFRYKLLVPSSGFKNWTLEPWGRDRYAVPRRR